MAQIVIELSEEQEEFVRKQAAQAGLTDPAEYVLSLVTEAERASLMAWLEAEVRKGLESGPAVEMTKADWQEIRRRVACPCD